jgi:MFS transporter, SP family, solute carrier family 2 (myo-inositol transporter), member 13
MSVRGIGTSLATFCNWAGNLLIGSTYLSLLDRITPAGAFGFYAGLCLLGWIFCVFCFPETAGLSLEEVQMVFRNGFGIKESKRLRREKAQILAKENGTEGDKEKREAQLRSLRRLHDIGTKIMSALPR